MTDLQELHAKGIDDYLQGVARLRRRDQKPDGWIYDSVEALLIERGRRFSPSLTLPRGVRRGRKGYCFSNAIRVVLRDPDRFQYCEGYASTATFGIPMHHGWTVERGTSTVIDPTWEDGSAYFGIAFDLHDALRALHVSGTVLYDHVNDMPLMQARTWAARDRGLIVVDVGRDDSLRSAT